MNMRRRVKVSFSFLAVAYLSLQVYDGFYCLFLYASHSPLFPFLFAVKNLFRCSIIIIQRESCVVQSFIVECAVNCRRKFHQAKNLSMRIMLNVSRDIWHTFRLAYRLKSTQSQRAKPSYASYVTLLYTFTRMQLMNSISIRCEA